MLPLPPRNIPGVLLFDRVYDATHRLSIAQEDFIGGSDVVIRTSNDGGATWVEIASFTPLNSKAHAMPAWDGADTYLILCDELAGDDWLFKSTDSGDNWARVTSITEPANYDTTNDPERFAYGVSAWWHSRGDSSGNFNIYKSVDDGDTWTEFHNNSTTEIEFILHPVYGLIAYDRDTASNGIRQSLDGVAALSVVLTHASAPWARIDDVDGWFVDGNSNLFGWFQDGGSVRRPYYNDDPADLTSWAEGALSRIGSGQNGNPNFGTGSGPGHWLWDGSKTHRKGFNSSLSADERFICWWTVDGTAWNPAPLNKDTDLSDTGVFGSILENYMGDVL